MRRTHPAPEPRQVWDVVGGPTAGSSLVRGPHWTVRRVTSLSEAEIRDLIAADRLRPRHWYAEQDPVRDLLQPSPAPRSGTRRQLWDVTGSTHHGQSVTVSSAGVVKMIALLWRDEVVFYIAAGLLAPRHGDAEQDPTIDLLEPHLRDALRRLSGGDEAAERAGLLLVP